MKKASAGSHWLFVVQPLVIVVAVACLTGCSKKQDTAASTAPVADAPAADTNAQPDAAAQPQDAGAQAQAQPQAPSGPVLDASQMGDAKTAMAEADAALRQRRYEQAVKTMLAIQQAQLNAQQAAAMQQQMINMQKNLANAAASGDQSAIAAGQMLRAGHSH